MNIDLHVHTNASDGCLTPTELVDLAKRHEVGVLAIADHDTVAGLPEARVAARRLGISLIPAIELSSHAPGSEVHVLGYFVDFSNPSLARELDALRSSREERAKAIVAKLNGLGLDIELARVQEIAGEGCIGRPHIAQALMEKGYCENFQEVFTKYLGFGGPAYVERLKLTPAEAIALINRCGGFASLAHPTTLNLGEMLPVLVAAGLAGLEVHYKDYTPLQREELARVARANHLIPTGGSDYHGIEQTEVLPGEAQVPPEVAEGLFSLARERGIDVAAYLP
jgi:3',5'-nucleoside bisphosphate phosphatase